MKSVDSGLMRRIENAAVDSGTPAAQLMLNAGTAAAGRIGEYCRATAALGQSCRIAVVIGNGNNGGDGIVAAGVLAQAGYAVTIFSPRIRDELSGDGAKFAAELPETVIFRHRPILVSSDLSGFGVIVDAVFGIGFSGTARPPLDGFIKAINSCGRPVISLDLPSGIDADTGKDASGAVHADRTLTFGHPKNGLFSLDGDLLSGSVDILPIGLEEYGHPGNAAFDVMSAEEAAAGLGRIARNSHKNTRGRVLLLCGSKLYGGAPVLAARGAAAGGAGMIRMLLTDWPRTTLEASWICRKCGFDGDTLEKAADFVSGSDVILAGCGWGKSRKLNDLLRGLLHSGKKLVLDADALNCVARGMDLWRGSGDVIITPHPGEALRLAEAFGLEVPAGRRTFALDLARKLDCVVLLKGHHSVIASPDGRCAVNPNGTPALAKAGSGDVLAGLTAALFADGRSAFDAAQLAAFLHGGAADFAAMRPFSADRLDAAIAAFMSKLSAFA